MTTETFNIQPMITVDQAERIRTTLEARQQVEEDCRRCLDEMLQCSTPIGGKDGNRIITAGYVAEARELLADWKVKNRAFEAAVFERKPGAVPT